MDTALGIALEDARAAGLLDGEKTDHVSFRAPKALIEAARAGLPVLTDNQADFDLLQQILPEGSFVYF
jgi:hypothetical protein